MHLHHRRAPRGASSQFLEEGKERQQGGGGGGGSARSGTSDLDGRMRNVQVWHTYTYNYICMYTLQVLIFIVSVCPSCPLSLTRFLSFLILLSPSLSLIVNTSFVLSLSRCVSFTRSLSHCLTFYLSFTLLLLINLSLSISTKTSSPCVTPPHDPPICSFSLPHTSTHFLLLSSLYLSLSPHTHTHLLSLTCSFALSRAPFSTLPLSLVLFRSVAVIHSHSPGIFLALSHSTQHHVSRSLQYRGGNECVE